MLLLDAGNSRIKWVMVEDGAWLGRGAAPAGDAGALQWALQALPQPDRIVASNVAGSEVARQIVAVCGAWSCKVEFITAQAQQCGVRNGYAQPSRLGSDRWAALIAAWRQVRSACLVVNCGTATTVDALTVAGEFMGGLILPGLEMMRASLAEGTAQLEQGEGRLADFPIDTGDAIYSGAIRATTGAILEQYRLLGAPGAPCVLGGGAAALIQPQLGIPLLREDDLVLKGLEVIVKEGGGAA